MHFLVTGCGRSGTNYIADRLLAAGINCGHERVYSVYGPLKNSYEYEGDSSWFAAPFIGSAHETKVLRVVREPRSVIESFHRIGLCADRRFRHFSGGKDIFSTIRRFNFNVTKIRNRLEYVNAHRKLLLDHTTCWDASDEFYRLCEYWYQWNKLIERNVEQASLRYLRIRLDEIDQRWSDIQKFLEVEQEVSPGYATNRKPGYRPVARFTQNLPRKVVELAKRYGFEDTR